MVRISVVKSSSGHLGRVLSVTSDLVWPYEHHILIDRLFHISQTTRVEDYVNRFAKLYDQLTAYESATDPLHYVTKFKDGFKAFVRMSVVMQKTQNMDTSYELALLHEELGEGVNCFIQRLFLV